MSPISPNKNTQSFSASSSSNSSLPNIMAQIDSIHAEEDAKAESVVQISQSSVVSNQVYGQNHTVTTNLYLTASDTTLITEKLWSRQSMALQPDTAPLAELGIKELQQRYLKGLQEDNEIRDALAMYIPPECTHITNKSERFSLEKKVREFLASEEKHVLLLLGEAGSGKSTFNKYLARSLWEEYNINSDENSNPIPVFIPLWCLDDPHTNLIYKYFERENFSKEEIRYLQKNHQFIFILDGYDEIKEREKMFYEKNRLDQWKAKVIFTSRPEYLGEGYRSIFYPLNRPQLFQEYRLAPLSEKAIENYIYKYILAKLTEIDGIQLKSRIEMEIQKIQENSLEIEEMEEIEKIEYLLEVEELGECYEILKQKIQEVEMGLEEVEKISQEIKKIGETISKKEEEIETAELDYQDLKKEKSNFQKITQELKNKEQKHDEKLKDVKFFLKKIQKIKRMIDQNEVQKIELETKKSKATANKEKKEKIKRLLSMKRKFLEWKKDLSLITKESYIERYLAEEVPGWNASRYKHTLKQLNLTVLVDNPFLLKIALETLPSLDETEQDGTGRQHFTRIALYDQFMHNWFQRSKNRLKLIQLTDEEEKIFKHLSNGGFSAFSIHSIDFSQKLAMAMHKAQVVAITFPDQIWKPFLNNESEETKLLRFNAPLIRQGNQYRFIHKTLQDYLVARALWKELESLTEIKHSGSPHKFEIVRNDIRLVWQKLRGFNELKSSLLFNELNIVKDPAVQSFLLERLQQNQSLLKVLLSWVKSSKEQAGIERAAANAITLLVKAGVYFNRLDLSQVKVPGADLSYGLFDHTRFQNADLKGVNCTGAWLRGVNLNGANLADLELGERPILKTKNWIDACCYSPDGLWLVTSERKDIQLYKVEGLQKIHTYTGHEGGVNNVAFSPDSQWLASGGGDKVKLWYVSGDRSLAHTYTGHKGKVASIAFSPNGQWLASGSKDKTVKLWDVLGERTLLHTYAENRGEVHCLAFSPDSQWLAAGFGFYDSTIKLWNVLGDWSLVHAYTEHESSTAASVTFSPDGKWLASGNYDSTVKLWNVLGERILVHTYTGHSGIVRSVVFSPEGEWLASGSSDKSVKLWRVTGERFLIHTYTGNSEQINSVAFSPNGQWLASSGWRSVKLWSVSGVRHTHAGHEGEVNGVAFSADGHWLASGSEDKTVRLWSVLDNKSLTHTYVGHKGKVKSIAFSPDGQWLASGSRDSSIKLWHVSGDRSLAHTYNRHENLSLINSVVFSPDSQWLASGRYDNTVHLWHVSGDRSLVHIYVGHSSSVNSVAFSPDGQWLASGSDDNTVKLWNILDDKFLAHTYVGHEDSVKSVAFSPDSQWLASGSRDNTIKLWAASGCGQLIYTYTGHTDYVNSVAFSPNGRWLASGSNDETVRLWPVLTDGFQIALQSIIGSSWPKKLLSIVDNGLHETLLALVDVVDRQVILKNFTGPVHAVAWQPNNGAILSTAGADGTLRLWRVSYGLSQIYTVALDWASKQDTLTARGSWIINARNLSTQNRELLMQHDAVGSHFRKFKKLN